MKTAARICSILALVVLLLATTGAFADTHVRIVRLSYLQGDVNVDLGQGSGSQRAVLNMPLIEGARVWTGGDGQAEVEFEDGSTVRITPNTGLEFVALGLRDSGVRVSTISVVGGTAYVDVPKLSRDDEFTFQLPNRSFTLTHSVHFRIDMDGMEARLAVMKGQLDVVGPSRSVDIHKGETLTLNLNDTGRYNLSAGIAGLAYDAWDTDRDDTIREVLNRNTNLYPYGYGYADLMNYGTFASFSGFGSCWRPYGVTSAWDPFDYGYWSYYPSFGYTWVSGYPWGWAPYRYGSWTYLDNTGWGWCPQYQNTGWYNWNIGPRYVNAPHQWHPPDRPIRHGNLPPIIPVGNRGPQPYRGGLIQDRPAGGTPQPAATPEETRRTGSGRHVGGGGGSTGGTTGGTPTPAAEMVPGPEIESRAPAPRRNRGIDLTPPAGPAVDSRGPSGRGPSGTGPIESPAQETRGRGGSPAYDRSNGSGGGGRPEMNSGPRMDSHAPPPSAPRGMEGPRTESPHMAPPPSPPPSSGPAPSAPSSSHEARPPR